MAMASASSSVASSSATTKKDDRRGGALSPSPETTRNDLLLVNSALKEYRDHMNVQINLARQKFVKLQNLGSGETDFVELQKAIVKLKLQIPTQVNMISTTNEDDQLGEAFPLASAEIITDDLILMASALKNYTNYMNEQIDLAHEKLMELELEETNLACPRFQRLQNLVRFKRIQNLVISGETDFDKLQKAIAKLKLQIPTQVNILSTINEEDDILLMESEDDLLLMESALKNYTDHMNEQINLAREKIKKLKNVGRREKDVAELRKAISKLKLQIPTQVNILSATNKNEYQSHGGALSPRSKLMHNDLLLVDSAFAETKEYMDHMSAKINQAHEKFKELQILRSSDQRDIDVPPEKESDFDELRKAIKKLKAKIPSHVKIRSTNSNLHRNNPWPNVNKAEDGMAQFFYKEPKPVCIGASNGLLKAYHEFPKELRHSLLCFFKFPPGATIKRSTMIYLWIGQGFASWYRKEYHHEAELLREEDAGNKIFDELVEKGFIEPVYHSCSLVPDSCRMSLSVRSSLYKEAEASGFTSNNTDDLDTGFVCGGLDGHSCLINVGEAIINWDPEIFENMKHIQTLYLGRWQSSSTHHIELANTKIFHGFKKLNSLKFLSLRGISMITELPTFILELKDLKILDLRACHNLEAIPNRIGLLKSITHLDISECYFLEHLPKSLAQLSNLEVLKGFFIGYSQGYDQCTLDDLSRLPKLRKLHICKCEEQFPSEYDSLQDFKGLRKLAISWGGYSLQEIEDDLSLEHRIILRDDSTRMRRQQFNNTQIEILFRMCTTATQKPFPPRLQKLDLRGLPATTLPKWLRPADLKELKKLYIRGGPLHDLGKIQGRQGEQWNVEILRLRYLSELEIDWRQLRTLFPKLIYFHQFECPKCTNFWCDERGVWMNEEAIDTHVQLQKYLRTSGLISSSSMPGSGPTLAQDDSSSR